MRDNGRTRCPLLISNVQGQSSQASSAFMVDPQPPLSGFHLIFPDSLGGRPTTPVHRLSLITCGIPFAWRACRRR